MCLPYDHRHDVVYRGRLVASDTVVPVPDDEEAAASSDAGHRVIHEFGKALERLAKE